MEECEKIILTEYSLIFKVNHQIPTSQRKGFSPMKNKKIFSVLLLLLLLSTLVFSNASAKRATTVNVQILAVNDFHGNLEPPAGSSGRIGTINAGGAEYLATHINNLRALNPNTVVVSAGDMIGASPLLSALFHDEPTIEAFNSIGLDFNAVGNHEFDEGFVELLRMQRRLSSC